MLSFIIVNYKSEKYLAKCFSSIKEKVLGMDYEVIVVNNDLDIDLRVLPPSEYRLINTNKNVGFGTACNIGAKESRGKILCFLNPDTEIVSKNITKLVQEFNKDTKLAIIGPKLIDESGRVQEWIAGKKMTIWSIIMNNLGYKRDKTIWESDKPVKCAWVSGAAMFMRKDIFQKLGGFDEKFFMYFEDIDLCRRAYLAEYKALYFPEFVIKHLGGKSFFDKKEQKRYYYKSQRRYLKKHLINKLKKKEIEFFKD